MGNFFFHFMQVCLRSDLPKLFTNFADFLNNLRHLALKILRICCLNLSIFTYLTVYEKGSISDRNAAQALLHCFIVVVCEGSEYLSADDDKQKYPCGRQQQNMNFQFFLYLD